MMDVYNAKATREQTQQTANVKQTTGSLEISAFSALLYVKPVLPQGVQHARQTQDQTLLTASVNQGTTRIWIHALPVLPHTISALNAPQMAALPVQLSLS